MKKFLLSIIIFLSLDHLQAQTVSFYVQADADDWQLFMSSNAIADLQGGGKTVFITLTAGDEGNNTAAFNGSAVPYYIARENGAVYAAKFGYDMLQTTVNTAVIPVIQTVTVNTHSLKKYVYANTVTYFLRLPDGNTNGNGFSATGNKSLKKLKAGTIPTIAAIDGSTTYTSWTDLTTTIATLINTERGLNTQVWLHTTSLDSTNATNVLNNAGDHSDHYYSSKAAQDGVNSMTWVGIKEYIGNRSSSLTANLTSGNFQNASGLFSVTDWTLVLNKYATKFTSVNTSLLPMDYFSTKRSPVGNALPVTLIDFAGQLQRNNVLLNWSTAAEYNSAAFEIERSADGVTYQKIGTLPAAGNSNVVKNYNYLDNSATELNYYRLRMTDLNGDARISNIVVIKNPGLQQDATVIENPFIDNISIRFAKIPKGKIAVSLTDMTGKLIVTGNYSQPASSLLYFNTAGKIISSGIYILHIEAEGVQYNIKLKKQ